MPQSLSRTLIHIIFSTKNRLPFIDESIENQLFSFMGAVCNNYKCQSIIVGGHQDHAHILCSLHRTVTQSDLVKEIKTHSSIWIKTKGVQYTDFYWQNGYAAFSVSESQVPIISRYIQNQKEHHQKQSFEQEYIGILNNHRVEYDDRYMWD